MVPKRLRSFLDADRKSVRETSENLPKRQSAEAHGHSVVDRFLNYGVKSFLGGEFRCCIAQLDVAIQRARHGRNVRRRAAPTLQVRAVHQHPACRRANALDNAPRRLQRLHFGKQPELKIDPDIARLTQFH